MQISSLSNSQGSFQFVIGFESFRMLLVAYHHGLPQVGIDWIGLG